MFSQLLRQSKQARTALITAIALGVMGTGITIAQMGALSFTIQRVFLAHASQAQVTSLLLLLLGLVTLRAALIWWREVLAQRASLAIKTRLRERLFAHIVRLGPAYTQDERTGEMVTAAGLGVEALDAYIARYLPQVLWSVLLPLLIFAVILPVDWSSALLLLVTGPIIPLLMALVGSYAEQRMQQQWLALSRLSAYFLDAIQGWTTLKLLGRGAKEHERITRLSELFRERTMKTLRLAFLSGMVLEFLATAALGLIAVSLGIRLLNAGITFERALFVLLLAPEFYRPLRELGVQRHAGLEGKVALKRINEILDTPLPPRPEGREELFSRQLALSLSNLNYTYPGHDHPALKDVSLDLPVGSCTALVGRSGAGKSTLAKLLLRFLDAQSGEIRVNGIRLSDLPVETWHEYVALVPQRPYLFYGSVRENIRLARPEADEVAVEQAARLAGASEFIQELPQGYETPIGERGARLSAGQIQRLAIARAFLKDAPLLLLDEPTSSLDPISEAHIREALKRLVQGRTTLVIAHRYATIQAADQVALLENGCLVEMGARVDIIADSAAYTRLLSRQRELEVTP